MAFELKTLEISFKQKEITLLGKDGDISVDKKVDLSTFDENKVIPVEGSAMQNRPSNVRANQVIETLTIIGNDAVHVKPLKERLEFTVELNKINKTFIDELVEAVLAAPVKQ